MLEVTLRPTTEADLDFVVGTELAPENGRFVVVWSRQQHAAATHEKDIAHRIVEEGTLRECVRAPGGYESLVVMSMLRDEYEAS